MASDAHMMQIRTTDFQSFSSIPRDGGTTMKLQGDRFTSFINGSYGVLNPLNVTFRGVPVRDVKAVYDDEAYFILGAYDESRYAGDEIILRDSNGHQGLLCTDIPYSRMYTVIFVHI